MQHEDYFKFMQVIHKHVYMAYQPTKEELLKVRLKYLKQNNPQKYGLTIVESAREYRSFMQSVISIALEFISMDEESFELSREEVSRNHPEVMQKVRQDEETVRIRLDKPEETKMGKDQIKNIILEQHTMEGELQKKLVTVTGKTKEEMVLLN